MLKKGRNGYEIIRSVLFSDIINDIIKEPKIFNEFLMKISPLQYTDDFEKLFCRIEVKRLTMKKTEKAFINCIKKIQDLENKAVLYTCAVYVDQVPHKDKKRTKDEN